MKDFVSWIRIWATCSALYLRTSWAGSSAYYRLEGIAEELDNGCIIEIGSDRGEGSTAFFSALANRTGRPFYSIDFSVEGFSNARNVCGSCAQQSMGEVWLEQFAKDPGNKIALAYLDNYDWTYPWTTQMAYKLQQHVDYGQQGLSLSNEKSQATHLLQSQWVERLCSEQCFVLFDDTWPSASMNRYSGKGGSALRFLLSHGFELIEQSPPDQPSFMGWVLVRRLPRQQRAEPFEDAPQSAGGSHGHHNVSLRILSAAQESESSEDPSGAVRLDLGVSGVADGEHTLVVYSNGVELMRLIAWPEPNESCAAGAAGAGAGGVSAEAAADNGGVDAGSGLCAGGAAGYARLPLIVNGLSRGPREIMLQVIDADHIVRATDAVSIHIT